MMTGYQFVTLITAYCAIGWVVVSLWCRVYKDDYNTILKLNKGKRIRTILGFLIYWPALSGYMAGDLLILVLRKSGKLS